MFGAIIIVLIILYLLYELNDTLDRHRRRRMLCNMARERAKELNRPLIIVGDPHNGNGTYINAVIMGQGYGYQVMDDEKLIDLYPCASCQNKPNTLKGDLCDELKKLNTDSCVIFVCLTLEYINNLADTVIELYRVTGSYRNLYINYIDRYALSHTLYKHNVNNKIITAPPYSHKIVYEIYKIEN